MKPRTITLNGPRNRWLIYIGFLGKWGDHLRIVRLNKRLRDVTGGWTLIKGPRPDDVPAREPQS